MEEQIRNINKPPYENPQLRQIIAQYRNSTSIGLNGKNLNDQDMEIVANDLLKGNQVS